MLVFILLNLSIAYEWEDLDVYIIPKGKNLNLAVFKNQVFRLVDKKLIDRNFEYFDIARINKIDTKPLFQIKYGSVLLCNSQRIGGPIKPCKTEGLAKSKLLIDDVGGCTRIQDEFNQCLTIGSLNYDNSGEIIETDKEYYDVTFQTCTAARNQCFTIKKIDKESNESKTIKHNAAVLNEYHKKNNPQDEILKDYDLRYVQKDLDEAHHFLAKEEPDSIISVKHYAPECFYGYNSMSLFLLDPLPNLRKLKQKYCIHNRKNMVSNTDI